MLAEGRHRDATMVSVLAYAGLRSDELQRLRWRNVVPGALRVRTAPPGDDGTTPVREWTWRNVRLVRPLEDDLAEWRAATSAADRRDLVFPPSSGTSWDGGWRQWVDESYAPIAAELGVEQPKPGTLRRTYLALQIYARSDTQRPRPGARLERQARAASARELLEPGQGPCVGRGRDRARPRARRAQPGNGGPRLRLIRAGLAPFAQEALELPRDRVTGGQVPERDLVLVDLALEPLHQGAYLGLARNRLVQPALVLHRRVVEVGQCRSASRADPRGVRSSARVAFGLGTVAT